MLNKRLEDLVCRRIGELCPIVIDDLAQAEAARSAGDLRGYFNKVYLGNYPDLYWILGDLSIAQDYYRLAGRANLEERAWYETNDPTFLAKMDLGLSVDAPDLVKAGMLDHGKEWLDRAYRWEMKQEDGPNHYHMRRIGLFAAQSGLRELSESVQYYVDAQLHMLRRSAEKTRRAAILVHHIEPAESQFLLGDYEECKRNLEQVLEGERFCEEQKVSGPYASGERNFIFNKARGLRKTIQLLEDGRRPESLFKEIVFNIEKAMGWAWRAGKVIDECYHLRLYTLMAGDILEGRPPDPNPFAEDAPKGR